MTGRGEYGVQTYPEGMLKHNRNDSFKNGAVYFQAGVIVDLNEPGFEIPIDHEIQPKDLEVILMSSVVDDLVVSLDDIGSHLFEFGHDISLNIVVFGRTAVVEVPLKFRIGQFICCLIFLIVI